jgi:peptidoglycan/LPS O-acetylase OafA/YrhL
MGAPGGHSKQIIGLDAARCMAALMVMAFHLGFWSWAGADAHPGYGGFPVSYSYLAPFTWFGWVGVEVFFVLSGFVIAYSASGASAFGFIQSRVLRLVPAAWICATITLVFVAFAGFRPEGLFSALHAWGRTLIFHPLGPWIDPSFWTLAIEISFYAVIFVLLALGSFHRVGWVIGAIGLASAAYWFARGGTALWPDLSPGLVNLLRPGGWLMERLLGLSLLRHGCFFAIGVFLWLSMFDDITRRRALMLAVLVCGGLIEIAASAMSQNRLSHSFFPPAVPCVVWLVLLTVIAASVFANTAVVARWPWLVGPMRTLGLMTYPLYLLHQVIGFTVLDAAHGLAPDEVILALTTLLIVALSYCVAAYLEPVLRRAFRRGFNAGALGRFQAASMLRRAPDLGPDR